jgi:amino acid adenylation domain-containing protein
MKKHNWNELLIAASQKKEQKAYWLKKLSGELVKSHFLYDFRGTEQEKGNLKNIQFHYSTKLSSSLIKLSNGSDVRLHVVFVAFLTFMLSKYTGNTDIILGTPVLKPDVEADFTNTELALRNQVQSGKTFKELLLQVRKTIHDAYENQSYPLDVLVTQLESLNQNEGQPLFDVAVLLENIQEKKHISAYPSVVFCFERQQDQVRVKVEYHSNRYKEETINRIVRNLNHLLSLTSDNVNQELKHLNVMTVEERKKVVLDFNKNHSRYSTTKTLHGLFEDQVKASYDRISVAVSTKEKKPKPEIFLTYIYMDHISSNLAAELEKRGLDSGEIVGILKERSWEVVAGILGILKTGAAYLPLNPNSPGKRIQYILRDSEARVLIIGKQIRDKVSINNSLTKLEIDEEIIQQLPVDQERSQRPKSTQVAYVIYTSGSTGKPKGVPITHSNITPLLHWGYQDLQIQPEDKTLQNVSVFFDYSVWEIFITLSTGASLHIIPGDTVKEPLQMGQYIQYNEITLFHVTPTQFHYFLKNQPQLETLRNLFIGGEKFSCESLKITLKAVTENCRVFNMYGPTEASIISTVLEIERSQLEYLSNLTSIPIGRPISNHKLRVLDPSGKLCPINVPGELCISGDGIARGYLNDPARSCESFIRKEYTEINGNQFYRTGDQVRWLSDGTLEFFGRLDSQVKIRGYRIELGEIEKEISEHPAIAEASVVCRESKNEENEKDLVAYLLGSVTVEELPGKQEMKKYLSGSLPSYMIPELFVKMERFPLTPNGKVDLKALPEPWEEEPGKKEIIAPRDQLEKKLVALFSEVLKIEESHVGIEDHFFEIGGHSLNATHLVHRIYQELGVSIDIEEVFKNPFIKQLAVRIRDLEPVLKADIQPREKKKYYPLSNAQRRLWVLCQIEQESIAYNMPMAFEIKGRLKIGIFKKVILELQKRHESLRTVFIQVKEEPFQRIIEDMPIHLEEIDLSSLKPGDKEKQAREIYIKEAHRPMDLKEGPLVRFKVILLEHQYYMFIYNIHHLVNDGWSQGIISSEIIQQYNCLLSGKDGKLPPLKIQYRDYASWHNQLLSEGHFHNSREYWLDKFRNTDTPNGIELPYDFPRRSLQTFNGGRENFFLEPSDTKLLNEVSIQQDVTLFMTLLTLLSIFLNRYSGQEDIVIGFPAAGRSHPGLYSMVGFLVNTLVFRIQVESRHSFEEHLKKVKKETLACLQYQGYPFDRLVEELDLERDLSQSPIFNVMMVHNSTVTGGRTYEMEGAEITGCAFANELNISKFDLMFFMDLVEGKLGVDVEYNRDLYKQSTLQRMNRNFQFLIKSAITHSDIPIHKLDYVHAGERQKLVREFNGKENNKSWISVQEMWDKQVEKTPEIIAVSFNRKEISYGELNQRANRMAFYLIEEIRIEPNEIIGISLERSLELMLSMLGVVKAGGCYLGIDPEYPEERFGDMLKDSQTCLVISDRPREYQNLPVKSNIREIQITSEWGNIELKSPKNPDLIPKEGDPLYVMYTSGSTGKPNGAIVSHGILSNLIQWQNQETTIKGPYRCLQFASVNFDVSIQEILSTLSTGGALHLIEKNQRKEPYSLRKFIIEQKIQIIYLPFYYLNFLFSESEAEEWQGFQKHNLRHVVTAGEQLKITPGLKRFLGINKEVQLHNHYGPAEMHVVTSYTMDYRSAGENKLPPIGAPISNTSIFILDPEDQLVPIGVWGELHLQGCEGTVGYLNRAELTHKKLLKPKGITETNQSLYRTGDIGRWREDGNIELRGRKDHQVKIRGFRVEPGEIENRILSVEGVQECVVTIKSGANEQKYLAAYVVLRDSDETRASEIRIKLSHTLPQYMIPRIQVLEEMPLLPNGKIDRKKLPDMEIAPMEEYVAPVDHIDIQVKKIWAKILGLRNEEISMEASFFELGGHSLKAVVLASRIEKVFEIPMTLTDIFKHPFLRDQAALLKERKRSVFTKIRAVEKREYYDLTPSQRNLWVLCQIREASISYNMGQSSLLKGKLDRKYLEQAFQKLVKTHETLRTIFLPVEGEPKQKILPFEDHPIGMDYINLLGRENNEEIAMEIIESEGETLFDLSKPPLLKTILIQLSEENHVFLLIIHHMICDAVSLEVMSHEMLQEYQGLKNGDKDSSASLRVQYKDFAHWQKEQLKPAQLKKLEHYWMQQLKGELPQLDIPFIKKRSQVKGYNGEVVETQIDKEITQKIKELYRDKGVTLYMFCLAALNLLLFRYTNQRDIIIGTPVSGRSHSELEGQVGYYINTLVMRTILKPDDSFESLLSQVRDVSINAFENQEYPFDKLLDKLNLKRDLSRHPLFDVLLNLVHSQGMIYKKWNPGFEVSPFTAKYNRSKFDLTVCVFEGKESLQINFEYNADLFEKGMIQRMVKRFNILIKGICENPKEKLVKLPIEEKIMLPGIIPVSRNMEAN